MRPLRFSQQLEMELEKLSATECESLFDAFTFSNILSGYTDLDWSNVNYLCECKDYKKKLDKPQIP
jgi:hypothetical protein